MVSISLGILGLGMVLTQVFTSLHLASSTYTTISLAMNVLVVPEESMLVLLQSQQQQSQPPLPSPSIVSNNNHNHNYTFHPYRIPPNRTTHASSWACPGCHWTVIGNPKHGVTCGTKWHQWITKQQQQQQQRSNPNELPHSGHRPANLTAATAVFASWKGGNRTSSLHLPVVDQDNHTNNNNNKNDDWGLEWQSYIVLSQQHSECTRPCNPWTCRHPLQESSLATKQGPATARNNNTSSSTTRLDSVSPPDGDSSVVSSSSPSSSSQQPQSSRMIRQQQYWYWNATIPQFVQARTYPSLSCLPAHARFQSHYQTADELQQAMETGAFNITQYLDEAWQFPLTSTKNQPSNETVDGNTREHSASSSQQQPPPQQHFGLDEIQRRRTHIFVEYNPTLTRLPNNWNHYKTTTTAGDTNYNEDDNDPNNPITYLASFRVTPWQSCLPWFNYTETFARLQWEQFRNINALGLALVRADLSLVQESTTVVPLESALRSRAVSSFRGQYVDYRLQTLYYDPFLSSSSNHEEQPQEGHLYLNINGPPVHLLPIRIAWNPHHHHHREDAPPQPTNSWMRIHPWYGESEALSLFVSKTVYRFQDRNGKNYAIFQTPAVVSRGGVGAAAGTSSTSSQHPQMSDTLTVEYNIWGPRRVQSVRLPTQHLDNHDNTETKKKEGWVVDSGQRHGSVVMQSMEPTTDIVTDDNLTLDHKVPPSSFATVDELWFPQHPVFKVAPHGGACCVPLPISKSARHQIFQFRHPNGTSSSSSQNTTTMEDTPYDTIMVGVGHTKVPHRPWMKQPKHAERVKDHPPHQYVSFFYALEPVPPLYRVVARSGTFCLPWALSETERETNARTWWSTWKPLNLKRQEFAPCPEISFVTGILPHATIPHHVIVTYGVNDCTSHVIVLHEQEILRLLFDGMDDDDHDNNDEESHV